MLFSSLEFLFAYLPITLLVYFISPVKFRNLWLLLVSLFFYGWGEPVYVFLMVFTIAFDYVCGYFVGKYRETDNRRAKIFLILSVVVNLGMLGYFKYYDFFAENLSRLPFLDIPTLGLELPIGISFYTFQIMSYVIDVYRGDARMQKNPIVVGAYVTLFPQLIAGPIVRYQDVDDQLRERHESAAMFASGIRTFVAGLAKKVIFANTAGALWDEALADPDRTIVGAWVGLLFYCFQIYFDFSGYSDMAIGLGKMLGFRFLENFNYPYISQSITEFWRRWHISLGTWFREYVYIPLGGNRGGKWKMYRNIFVVWFLTGFWHGADWNFIIWGLYYFALLVVEKTFLLDKMKAWPKAFRHIYTLFFVYFGWFIFYFENMGEGISYLGTMFGVGGGGFVAQADIYAILHRLVFLAICVIASLPQPRRWFYRFYEKSKTSRYVTAVGCLLVTVLVTAYLVDSSYNPFLYFRF
ncbi:MAG: MBOAT family protein [Clostridia bacterium]|nr:MBOAT family protein [Clostridia bacterium]